MDTQPVITVSSHSDKLPLEGLTVVDWTHVLSGPFTSYNLRLLGATVIRIERVDGSDIIRTGTNDLVRAKLEMGDAYVMLSGGKESLAIDARVPTGKAALLELIGKADVLVENFRPGKLRDLGFDPMYLIERFPRLIVCSISGFGQTGHMSQRPAYDHVIQAASGMMSVNADEDGKPQRVGVPLVDYATGMHAALGILAALQRRTREEQKSIPQKRGEWLDVSLFNTALTLLAPAYSTYAVSGQERKATRATAFSGNPLSGTFAGQDGVFAIVCNTEKQSKRFVDAVRTLGVDHSEVQRLGQAIEANDVEAVHKLLNVVFERFPLTFLENAFVAVQVPFAKVRTPSEAYASESKNNTAWPALTVPGLKGQTIQAPGIGFGSTRNLDAALTPPPLRGEHSRQILSRIGIPSEVIEQMCAQGVLLDTGRST
ncbi:CaiB/BaiF CoA transferase family protein [Allopusillimonas ginsengisoli]|uniref:CaiB/BaiF CoA transferase family protein n=1 Tax=Allopusillimonas ginsengisoli TaxID=453575 RepID=UPI0014313A2B|nr:CaiB/BaiF CoA-transferase family protein [Allopusillimonas ginsengisoli]